MVGDAVKGGEGEGGRDGGGDARNSGDGGGAAAAADDGADGAGVNVPWGGIPNDAELQWAGSYMRRSPHAMINVLWAQQLEAAENIRSSSSLYVVSPPHAPAHPPAHTRVHPCTQTCPPPPRPASAPPEQH